MTQATGGGGGGALSSRRRRGGAILLLFAPMPPCLPLPPPPRARPCVRAQPATVCGLRRCGREEEKAKSSASPKDLGISDDF